MKIINTGSKNVIYSDDLVVLNSLEPTVYNIAFSNMTGYSLVKRQEFCNSEIMYGDKVKKIDKIIRTFETGERNLGIILSGEKGMGKTMFARRLCSKMLDKNYPVIIVSELTPGLVDFINSIDQEIVLLFDEFEKVFRQNNDGEDEQNILLPLFDGTSPGKKMFLLTVNQLYLISDFFLNRPGRFHYHLRFNDISQKEAREYFEHEIDEKYADQIQPILNFVDSVKMNYDCLRAIAFEINLGENIVDVIDDLNIINYKNSMKLIPVLIFNDGTKVSLRTIDTITSYYYEDEDDREGYFSDSFVKDNKKWIIRLNRNDIKLDTKTRNMRIDIDKIKIEDYEEREKFFTASDIGISNFELIRNTKNESYKNNLISAYSLI